MIVGVRWTCLLLLLMAGCGSDSIAVVEGTVTLDGKPLPDIRVLFQPENLDSQSAGVGSFGLTDASGKFVLKLSSSQQEGAAVGKHSVTLADKLAEDPADSDAGYAQVPKSRIPAKFAATPLVFEVKPGIVNQANFELKVK